MAALIAALGLFLFGNAGYTIAFAVALLFFSVAKPTPDRIIRVFEIKGRRQRFGQWIKKKGIKFLFNIQIFRCFLRHVFWNTGLTKVKPLASSPSKKSTCIPIKNI
jgi:hypothetical protein